MRSVFRGTKKGPHAEERPQGLWGRVSKHAQRLSSIADATCRRCAPALMAGADYPPRRTPMTATAAAFSLNAVPEIRSEEHTSELHVTNAHLVCRLLLYK